MKRTVAIKLLHSHFHNNPDTIRRFQKEAEAISTLSHENVVRVFDFGQLQHGQPYMVMSYVSGKSLSQTIKQDGPLDLGRCLKLFIQIGKGLEHAHKKHIVHRDLKPTNVMLTRDDNNQERVVIVDFGIAKFMDEGDKTVADLTRTGAVIGSPHYMSPEQCLGQTIDLPCDIYSFGCLMYEALVGKPMFSGGSSLEIMQKHVNEKPPALSSIKGNQALKPHIQAIIHHALEKTPAQRYQTATDLVHDLTLLDEANQKGFVPKLSDLKACFRGRIRRMSLAAVVLCFVLCAGQMYFWWMQPVQKHAVAHRKWSTSAHFLPESSDDASLKEFVKKYPDADELSATGISGKGMPDIAKLSNLKKLTLQGCTADDTALSVLSKLTKLQELTLKDSKIGNKALASLSRITSLKKLMVEGNNMTDAGLASLLPLKNLHELMLKNIKVLGPGVHDLAGFPQLRSLFLVADSGTGIKDDSLKVISECLPDLTTLKLESTQLTDAGLSNLSRFKNLRRFSLSFSPKITDKGLDAIAKLNNLRWLNINGTEVTDAGLITLSRMKGLEEVFFYHTHLTDAGTNDLNKIKTLQVLHLTHTGVSDIGLSRLTGLVKLRDLKLRDTKVTDDGLKVLKNFKHLERLSLQDLPITDQALIALADVPSLSELDISGTIITDAGLRQLSKLKSLKQLYVKDCHSFTQAGLEALKLALPDCKVHSIHIMPSRAME